MTLFKTLALMTMLTLPAMAAEVDAPLADEAVVFEEVDGLVAVEAEHFHRQEKTDVRQWLIFSEEKQPEITPDGDPPHLEESSGGAYIEALPDSRRVRAEKLVPGENYFPQPGLAGVLTYNVYFNTPGRYYVWGRVYSAGTEDNGLHSGIDGQWPESGQRMQWIHKNKWAWRSHQRTKEKHTGVPYQLYLDIDEPGLHTIHFSIREDGTEFDKWLMTTDRDFEAPEGVGPDERRRSGPTTSTHGFGLTSRQNVGVLNTPATANLNH